MQWYYATDGEQKGPFTDAAFLKLIDDGVVGSSTLVWNETMTDWLPKRNLNDVISKLARQETAAPSVDTATSALCHECGKLFKRDDMITYQGVYVCGACKPAFFQRVEEGGAVVSSVGGTGQTHNRDLMASARMALSGNWGISIGFVILSSILLNVISGLFGIPAIVAESTGNKELGMILNIASLPFSYFLMGVFQVGQSRFFMDVARGDIVGLGRMFYGFKFIWKAGGVFLLMIMRIFLWSLLLIIPGILAAFSYSMALYVIADNPDLSITEALARSKKMMDGNRWKFFCLQWRFFGWSILCIFTCFIGFLWLAPYMATAQAKFYDDVRGLA
jgi:uncharacterized membrane protein